MIEQFDIAFKMSLSVTWIASKFKGVFPSGLSPLCVIHS